MSQLLTAYTSLPIHEVESEMMIEPNQIYLIPAGRLMTIKDGHFQLGPRDPEKMPINIFMDAVADCYGNQAVGVIFSGTGSDGTLGATAIRQQGGLIIAQSPETAEFSSMPQSIISKKLSHAILSPEAMWPAIEKYTGDPEKLTREIKDSRLEPNDRLIEDLNIGYTELFEFLKRLYEIDFSRYKITSVSRRIQRRMEQHSMSDVADYLKHLEQSQEESAALYRDLLIGVTEFFRDGEIYDKLATEVIEPAFSSPEAPEQFRIWVAGCASGEEAYSMAILTDELARKHNYQGHVSIFATDIHKGSVQIAGQGVYTKQQVAKLSDERLARYFKVTDEGDFRVKPEIRQKVVFAPHNLLVDPPFTRMDLVTCRNLLIYLKPDAQDSVLRCFHYALHINGHLLLGSSESLGEVESAFRTVSTHGKIFRKQNDLNRTTRPQQLYARPDDRRSSPTHPSQVAPSPSTTIPVERKLLDAYDLILKRYAPTGVLITREREVRHYFGEVASYCQPSEGRADSDFLSMLKGDLKLAVSTTLQRVLSQKQPLRSERVKCTTRHGDEVIDVSIAPYIKDGHDLGLLLVTFEPRQKEDPAVEVESITDNFRVDEQTRTRMLMLEDELRSTKENLQATVEELQTSNEELQAINEEVQVSNEELQSTNEELHSMNEELYTVNAELEQKNQQLVELNSDHENLLTSTEDGVLYIDQHLRIKKFNPAISFAFHLMPQDVGRPVEHIAYNLENREHMLADIQDVLNSGIRKEREEKTSTGIAYLRRLTPFLDDDDNICGVVLTFTDITESSQMRSRLSRAMETAGMAWWEWDLQTDRLDVHAEGECILGYDCNAIQNNSEYWFERVHPDDLERVRSSLTACIEGKADEWVCEHRYLDSRGIFEWVLETGRVTRRMPTGRCLEMTGTTMNIHARKTLELDLTKAKDNAEAALKAKASFLSTMSHEIRTPLNGICGMAEILSLELQDAAYTEHLKTITSSAYALLDLINSILEFSKTEAGKLELILKKHALTATVSETLDVLNARIKEKQIQVNTHCELSHDYFIYDAVRLKQVLLNLVGNAVKFTPDQGEITISIGSLPTGAIQFTIQDNGIGIDPKFQQDLFNPFTQEDNSDTRKYGGTGLGLSISKQLIELMGGQIEVQSEPGVGSSFIFTLQAEPTDAPEESRPPVQAIEASNRELRALIVDDDAANRMVMDKMLEKLNIKSDTAFNGSQAMERLGEQSYDCIFMDLQMPGDSGYVVTKKIRSGQPNAAHKTVPIIAFTADASSEAHDRIDQGGFDGILVKPVSMQGIGQVIDKL
jgi:two-component system CheB/CheR fusion protein